MFFDVILGEKNEGTAVARHDLKSTPNLIHIRFKTYIIYFRERVYFVHNISGKSIATDMNQLQKIETHKKFQLLYLFFVEKKDAKGFPGWWCTESVVRWKPI